jgi:hypothetical protein
MCQSKYLIFANTRGSVYFYGYMEFRQKVCETVSADDTEAMQVVNVSQAPGELTRLNMVRLLLVDSLSLSRVTPGRVRRKGVPYEQVLVW